jgi:hypothetical protein
LISVSNLLFDLGKEDDGSDHGSSAYLDLGKTGIAGVHVYKVPVERDPA